MATVYSGWSDTWKPSGSSVNKQYRARLDYSTSYNDTTFDCTATTYFNLNSSVTVESTYNSASMSATGQTTATGSFATVFEKGNTVVAVSTRTYSWPRTTYAQSITVSGSVRSTKKDWDGYWMTASATFTIPALASYTVSYNANEGTSAPAAQTKWYNINLSLQSGIPTRTGYTFTNWNTLSNPSETTPGTTYQPGATYTANAGVTLYAQWTANEYTVNYNKNDAAAVGTMNSSTFTYDIANNLSSNMFTKKDHLFVGWATTPDGAVQFTDGQEILNLSTGDAITLYAIWKYQYTAPDLQNPIAYRTTTGGAQEDTGTGFFTSVYVIPGIKETSLNVYDSNRDTTLTAFYKISSSSTWIQIDADRTTPQIDSYVVNIPTTTGFNILEGNIQLDLIYDIKFIAELIEKILSIDTTVDSNKIYYTYDSTQDIFTEVVPIGNENPFNLGWYEDEVKISNTTQTMVPAAKFLFDANPTNDTMGLFTSAPNEESNAVVLGSGGDIKIEYEESDGEGSLDYDINQALAALAGEDASLNNVPLSYVGGATLGAGTVTLSVANWSNNSQTVLASGVTTSSIVLATPAPSSYDEYVVNNIRCTGQSTGELTFTCDFIPSSELVINIINIVIA